MDFEKVIARGIARWVAWYFGDLVVCLPDEVEGRAADGEEDDRKQDGQRGKQPP